MQKADVIIVGGGLAGLTLAALLGAGGASVVCLDRDAPQQHLGAAFDGRTTAISYGSRKVLQKAGVWDALEAQGSGACPIRTVQILDGASPRPDLVFESAEAGGRIFGWIVDNRDFRQCLFDRVKSLKTVKHVAPAAVSAITRDEDYVTVTANTGEIFRAPLLVGADGRQSFVRDWAGIGARDWSYGQKAIICTAVHENPHNHVAVEHFRSEGPFAILPMTDDAEGRHRSSVVWTVEDDAPLRWPQDVFDAGLAARFPGWYGTVRQVGRRFAYPLGLTHAHRYTDPRVALIAEAAHGIHPIAGQGLNLSFRDLAALAPLALDALARGRDPGSAEVLDAYQRQRRVDNMAMAGATDTLNRLFSTALPPVAAARKLGMRAVAKWPRARRFFIGQAMGSAGVLPEMIRESRAA